MTWKGDQDYDAGQLAAAALRHVCLGLSLPFWDACRRLVEHELLLLSADKSNVVRQSILRVGLQQRGARCGGTDMDTRFAAVRINGGPATQTNGRAPSRQ